MDAALEKAYPDSDLDDEKFIKRPDAERLFEDVIKSPRSTYSVIVGSHGTGKSTLARKVARKTQGMIYVNVPADQISDSVLEVVDSLDSALQKVLDWHKPLTARFPVLLSKFSHKAEILLQSSKRVLIIVFIVPRTDQFLPRRLTGKQRNSKDFGGFRAGWGTLT